MAAKRATVKIGGSTLHAGDLRGLTRAYRQGTLVPILGAGVSLSRGVPTWRQLVVELLFEHGASVRAMRELSPDDRRGLAEWLADYLGYDLTILARVVKNTARKRAKRKGERSLERIEREFVESVRRRIYAREIPDAKGETTLSAIASFVARGASRGKIPAVVTFNYDDLLERELTRLRVRHHVLAGDRRTSGSGLCVLHPHGYLPREGPTSAGVIFTEDEYHRLGGAVFHWAHGEIIHHLRRHNALFVGLSMSDPNLRRLLDASYVHGDVPAHWQVQRRRVPEKAADPKVASARLAGVRLAERFERELFESMGTKTVWLDSFADIPPLLRAIANDLPAPSSLLLYSLAEARPCHSTISPRSSRIAAASVSPRSSRTS